MCQSHAEPGFGQPKCLHSRNPRLPQSWPILNNLETLAGIVSFLRKIAHALNNLPRVLLRLPVLKDWQKVRSYNNNQPRPNESEQDYIQLNYDLNLPQD